MKGGAMMAQHKCSILMRDAAGVAGMLATTVLCLVIPSGVVTSDCDSV